MDEKEFHNSQRKENLSYEQKKLDMDSDKETSDDEDTIRSLDSLHTYQYRENHVMRPNIEARRESFFYSTEEVEGARRRINEFYSKRQGDFSEPFIQRRLHDCFSSGVIVDPLSDYNLHLQLYSDSLGDSMSMIVQTKNTKLSLSCKGIDSRVIRQYINIGEKEERSFKDISAKVSQFFGNGLDVVDDQEVYIKWERQQIKEALAQRLDSAVNETLCKSLLVLDEIRYKTLYSLQIRERKDVIASLLEVLNVRRVDKLSVYPAWIVTYVTREGIVEKGLFEMRVYETYLPLDNTELMSDQRAKDGIFRHSNRDSDDLPDFTPPLQWNTENFGGISSSAIGLVACRESRLSHYCYPPFVLWMDGMDPFRNQIVLSQTALRKCIDTFILCIEKSMVKQYLLPVSIWKKIAEMLMGVKPRADMTAVANAKSVLRSFTSQHFI
jgi:hypothetical protein